MRVRRACRETRLEVDPVARAGARPWPRARRGRHRARRPPDLHGDARAARDPRRARRRRARTGRAAVDEDPRRPPLSRVPEHLRRSRQHRRPRRGARRCAATSSRSTAVGVGDALDPGAYDLLYIGGGQDREQALIAPDLVAKGDALRARRRRGVAMLAVCGGYQLLGRGYRGARRRRSCRAPASSRTRRSPGDARMIGDVLLECELEPGERRPIAGFENHAGRTLLDPGAEPLGRVVHGLRQRRRRRATRAAGSAARSGRTSTARCFRGTRGSPTGSSHGRSRTRREASRPRSQRLPDELEAEAFRVAAERARARGGRR